MSLCSWHQCHRTLAKSHQLVPWGSNMCPKSWAGPPPQHLNCRVLQSCHSCRSSRTNAETMPSKQLSIQPRLCQQGTECGHKSTLYEQGAIIQNKEGARRRASNCYVSQQCCYRTNRGIHTSQEYINTLPKLVTLRHTEVHSYHQWPLNTINTHIIPGQVPRRVELSSRGQHYFPEVEKTEKRHTTNRPYKCWPVSDRMLAKGTENLTQEITRNRKPWARCLLLECPCPGHSLQHQFKTRQRLYCLWLRIAHHHLGVANCCQISFNWCGGQALLSQESHITVALRPGMGMKPHSDHKNLDTVSMQNHRSFKLKQRYLRHNSFEELNPVLWGPVHCWVR